MAINEGADLLTRFFLELAKATNDGREKRSRGEKPPWYIDDSHETAIYSHFMKWKRGDLEDPHSGAHPLVHAAWRCLAIACRETGNIPVTNTKEQNGNGHGQDQVDLTGPLGVRVSPE